MKTRVLGSLAVVAFLAGGVWAFIAPHPDPEKCKAEFTTQVSSALNDATSEADFTARMDALGKKYDDAPPKACRGLSDAEAKQIGNEVVASLTPQIMAKAFEWSFGGAQ